MGFTITLSVKDVPAEKLNEILEQVADVLDEHVETEREITVADEAKWTTGSRKTTLKTKAVKGLELELANLGIGFETPLERAAHALQRGAERDGVSVTLSSGDRVVTFDRRETTPAP